MEVCVTDGYCGRSCENKVKQLAMVCGCAFGSLAERLVGWRWALTLSVRHKAVFVVNNMSESGDACCRMR